MASDAIGNYLKKKAYGGTQAEDLQVIPARHGVATFVPSGSTIKIVNTSGTQVVDTWAFALPNPPTDREQAQAEPGATKQEPTKPETPKPTPKKAPKKSKNGMDLPSQEDAEKATASGIPEGQSADGSAKKSGWSSYLPSMGLRGSTEEQQKQETKKNSRTWGQYFEAGRSFTNYIPTKNSVSAFANSHNRDKNKPYIEQLADFSRTPVGAAGISALSGSGYASSLYAGYSAWTGGQLPEQPPMEYLSMPHSRASTGHMVPKPNDTLVSNLREPMLTVLEDTSPGVHDTLIAACDPQRYKGLDVENWEQHGSCAENLVMALKELNERAGLKGPKGIGADVTVNAVPAPLNLFMNIPWSDSGDIEFASPAGKDGDYIRLRAERDVVMVMSACPQDVLKINAQNPTDAHFVVEEETQEDADIKARLEAAENEKTSSASSAPKRAPPKKLNGSAGARKPSTTPSTAPSLPAKKHSPPAAAPAAAPKPAAKRTPVGQTKTPVGQKKTPIGQTKTPSSAPKEPASSSPSTGSAKPKTPLGTTKSRAPLGSTKTPKPASAPKPKPAEQPLRAASPVPESTASESVSGGAQAEKEKAAPAQAPAAEKKKPRKLGASKKAAPAAAAA